MTETISQNEMKKNIEDYIDVITQFMALIQQENEALKAYDVIKVSDLYPQKAKIVMAYRNMVAFFIKNQHLLNAMPEEDKGNLKKISTDLDALLQENNILLKTRMETSESVIGSIVNAAKASTKKSATSYGAHGQFAKVDNHHSSMAINSTFQELRPWLCQQDYKLLSAV